MADIEPSTPGGENNLLDRILAAESVLVALRCGDTGMVTSALRHIALQTGKALYVWRPRAGLCRLRDHDERIPGAVELAAGSPGQPSSAAQSCSQVSTLGYRSVALPS